MNQKEIRELIEFLIEKDVAEFELERGDVKLRIRRGPVAGQTAMPSASQVPAYSAPGASLAQALPAAVAEEKGLHTLKSPIVGTFYEAPSPGAPPFVKPGDRVKQGQTVCIVEAMKLMNEIECDAAGEVVKVLVGNGQPVEYGQPLFSIRPE
jgi:acetyl-CoA carboxylase biotin carboxyl carrier protein